MVTSKAPLSLTPPPATTPNSRFYLLKAIRRFIRTVRTELRLFLSRTWNRPTQQPVSVLLALIATVLIFLTIISAIRLVIEVRKDDAFYNHPAHVFLPPSASFHVVQQRQCSWLYIEFGAKDGRHVNAFLANGNHFLEEFLRATQSPMRAFCAIAFEPDLMMRQRLHDMRKSSAKHAKHVDIFTEVVPGANDQIEEPIRFKTAHSGLDQHPKGAAMSIPLAPFLQNVTFEWSKSGHDVHNMVTPMGNGNRGAVIVRFNQLVVREALWYLDLLRAHDSRGVLCTRVDRLILDFEKISINPSEDDQFINRDVVRDWRSLITSTPSHPMFSSTDHMSALIHAASVINENPECRARIHIFDSAGKMILPQILSNRNILYAILAGQPTFNERVHAQTATWMTSVPEDRSIIYTNVKRENNDLVAANGRTVAVVHPHRPELEQHLSMMQSWSHLVRTRESWDRIMSQDESIQWLALVDDDTFVFPGGIREYLSSFDHRTLVWGGSGEMARIDNGDAGKFANWLRQIHEKNGGAHCYLRTEQVPKHLSGSHVEYVPSEVMNGRKVVHKVSHMCHDTFCKMGCPAVPQGAAIFVSRALVKALRPFVEECERDTANLCKNCGSQRLYMCVNRYTNMSRTLLSRGVCRSPWKLEHRERFPFALTFHGFNRYHGMTRSTKSFFGDMQELWTLGKQVEEEVDNGQRASYLIPMPHIANLIACHNKGRFEKGMCIGADGKQFKANDGKSFRSRSSSQRSSNSNSHGHPETRAGQNHDDH